MDDEEESHEPHARQKPNPHMDDDEETKTKKPADRRLSAIAPTSWPGGVREALHGSTVREVRLRSA